MFSYIIPTRNRTTELLATLRQLASLHSRAGASAAQIVIADNASNHPITFACAEHALGAAAAHLSLHVIHLRQNHGAAARNIAAAAADTRSRWLVMLDDDSAPLSLDFVPVLESLPHDIAAVAAEIILPAPHAPHAISPPRAPRESGGLPEVFIGCGVALRRDVFTALGGYDQSFGYYVEEYDLAAKIIAAGYRTILSRQFLVLHRKVAGNRDMNLILSRLVRNNLFVALRHAPSEHLAHTLTDTLVRYFHIALKERALPGYLRGLGQAFRGITNQNRTPLSDDGWARLTGLAAARHAAAQLAAAGHTAVTLVAPGKHAWAVRQALAEHNISESPADAGPHIPRLIATLSPGPMWDAAEHCAASGSGFKVVLPLCPQASAVRPLLKSA